MYSILSHESRQFAVKNQKININLINNKNNNIYRRSL